ncbi:hypothetical protein [Clavibacter michiganensis]|nr:hypothetical protein [Clavibacter michiganensis]MDO4099786.1 hypothetical protein [Clavibacter michiganensis]MDO4128584.1 hypothetical protein [Clavibacter michiganensis]
MATALRGWGDPGAEEVEDPAHVGDRAGLPREGGIEVESRPDGMIDR